MDQINGFHRDFAEKIQNTLDAFVRDNVCAGASIAVGRFGELAVRYNSGWADLENQKPICEHTLFQMHSLTKPVTAVAVLQLWEKGCFQLSDPISKYLPAFENVRVCHVLADGTEVFRPAKNQITIHDLLTMTSGITYDEPGLVGDELKRLSDGMVESKRTKQPWDTMEYVRRLAQVPLVFEPGEGYKYGLGFDVLGALVEVCSGKRLDRYCRDHIFSPLGMESATYFLTEAHKHALAVSYTSQPLGGLVREQHTGTYAIDAYTLNNTSYASGGSGLICTLDDYFKFAKMLANQGKTDSGEMLISERTLKQMSEPRLTDAQRKSFPLEGRTCLRGTGYSYGCGAHVMTEPENYVPVGEWGWAGTMGTWLSIDPKNEVFWVYAHQVAPSVYESYIPELSKIIYSCLQ